MYQEKIDDDEQQDKNDRLYHAPDEQPVKKALTAMFHKPRSRNSKILNEREEQNACIPRLIRGRCSRSRGRCIRSGLV